MSGVITKNLRRLKQGIRSLTAGHFWLRYPTLAAYRALCAAASALTGFTMSGAAHTDHSTDEAVGYITSVFDKYKSAAGIKCFHGKVAEIDPVAISVIGLMFLSDVSNQVYLAHPFFS